MGPLKRSLCGRNGLFGEEHAQHTTVILEWRRVFDMIVYYLFMICAFCSAVWAEKPDTCVGFNTRHYEPMSYRLQGHSEMHVQVYRHWIPWIFSAVWIGRDSRSGQKWLISLLHYLSLSFFFFFLHFTHFILLSCNNPVHHNTHRSRFRMMFRVIWLWWKMSGCVDMDLQAHVASSTIHLPPNLKVLAGCVHLSMVLSSSHSPSPIFHWDMTMAPTAGSVYTSQKQPASSAITYAALHFDLKLGSHKTP